MKLVCYLLDRPPFHIRPAVMQKQWMENSPDRFAYRCLPLNISNSHGWEICCDETFDAIWNGGNQQNDIQVSSRTAAISHFGSGVLTFHISGVFRTEPGWNLMVMGPPNSPKRGIHALTGVIETDWAPYSFTMNWIFTEPNHKVTFTKGEPFCFIFPIPRGVIDKTEPSFQDMRSEPMLLQQHIDWMESRDKFIQDLKDPYSEASKEKWQRKYFQGQNMVADEKFAEHQTRIRAREFVDLTKSNGSVNKVKACPFSTAAIEDETVF